MKANQKWQSFQIGTTLTFPCAMTQEDNVFHNRVLRHWLLEGYQNHGNWQQLLGGSMRPHWATAWEEVTHAQHWDFCSIAHVSERSLVPQKRELYLKCFYMGIFIFYETSKIIGFHMTFSRLLVFAISPQPSPLLCPPIPQLHLILLTFLVFIKFFTDKEKRYFSFSFFTFILCLARLLKVLSELKVF